MNFVKLRVAVCPRKLERGTLLIKKKLHFFGLRRGFYSSFYGKKPLFRSTEISRTPGLLESLKSLISKLLFSISKPFWGKGTRLQPCGPVA